MKIKIASINMEYGGALLYGKTKSKKAVIKKYIDLIQDNKLDIICFQEAFFYNTHIDTTKTLAKKLGYYHTNHKKAYLSIISKYPISVEYKKNNVLTCKCYIGETKIYVTNIHLNDIPFTIYSLYNIPYPNTPMNISVKEAIDLSYESKESDINSVLKFYKKIKEPSIICGDFNELSYYDSDIKWKVSRKLTKMFTDITRAIYKNPKKYPMYTWDIKGLYPMRIDMIYSRNIKCLKIKNLKNDFSDHIPIITTFKI
jgi:exonuclease III